MLLICMEDKKSYERRLYLMSHWFCRGNNDGDLSESSIHLGVDLVCFDNLFFDN